MYQKTFMKIGAVAAAVALTLAGTVYSARQAQRNAVLPASTSSAQRPVIILDAGHGGSA